MTENEAIEFMKRYLDAECYTDKCVNAHIIAINALEEVQKYRAIGAPEECRVAVERNNEKTRIIDGVTECCGYYVGPGVFQRGLLNPALFAVGKLKGAMKNEIICGKCGCGGPYVKIKEFPNKMDAQGKAKETWNRRVNELMNSTVRRMIREQPVAYDVDKVVEQLEAYSNADEAERLGTMPVVELADAIKIVKGGGVDG